MDVGVTRWEYHNEIDHIIVNRRYCLTDVGVVPKFYTGSDHRLLRARFFFLAFRISETGMINADNLIL
ncbi:hypothetical protein Y032_0290g1544 [Ancylostoma ceylanicum]|uniref:Endonuclease/exonuclease/phosphatase domain-containing protein n=1 Tax=Ancylostoma ceylanicum TaxID=53326 RepID=A0A016S6F7_9BILA|nr:hypothetical protein Y032_0290g1544 [Ancylostoma ceylanicum]